MVTTLLRTLIFTLLLPGTVTVWLPLWLEPGLFAAHPTVPILPGVAGYLLAAVGAAIYLWCAWDFARVGRGTPAPWDAPRALVVNGLYRYTRNPMYVGVSLVVWGEAVFTGSPPLLRWAIIVPIVFHLFIVLYEEPALRRKYGEAYDRYRADTPRWLWAPGRRSRTP
jgi:protein-S-isoprenylcysteine O-methyltransferase Ste14